VTTSETGTTFDDVACSALVNGALVTVTGTTAADGSILATKVEAQAGPDEVTGTVFELTGTASCTTPTPALTFKVGATALTATTVNSTTTTAFAGVACATLANGANVEVEGTTQADGSITAASVELH
jgi:predicted ribosome-associated RNA-binding protein Tma20